ncbi:MULTISPECIES: hypothetical protein [unclassified Methylobacterium]|uniref:hypothetical protein n=1 Tax=unclassified Methylobacterium TaxID=2615210 RepID=UPI000152D9F3|nr:hypothetical protein [Methylobacterium sp. 4-46]
MCGPRQEVRFAVRDRCLESFDEIPEAYAFTARLNLRHLRGTKTHEVAFEEHDRAHDHINLGDEHDAHARAHADAIRQHFAGHRVTSGQIVLFGLTGV